MSSAALFVIGVLILIACIIIIVLLSRKSQRSRGEYDMDKVQDFVHDSVRAALKKQNEELASHYGEIFREAERIDNMLSDDKVDIASIIESTSTRVLAMLVSRLEDECISLTSDIRKVSQKISLANVHLSSHLAANVPGLASDAQKSIENLEAQKKHLEERQATVQKKLDDLKKTAEELSLDTSEDDSTKNPQYRCGVATKIITSGD